MPQTRLMPAVRTAAFDAAETTPVSIAKPTIRAAGNRCFMDELRRNGFVRHRWGLGRGRISPDVMAGRALVVVLSGHPADGRQELSRRSQTLRAANRNEMIQRN